MRGCSILPGPLRRSTTTACWCTSGGGTAHSARGPVVAGPGRRRLRRLAPGRPPGAPRLPATARASDPPVRQTRGRRPSPPPGDRRCLVGARVIGQAPLRGQQPRPRRVVPGWRRASPGSPRGGRGDHRLHQLPGTRPVPGAVAAALGHRPARRMGGLIAADRTRWWTWHRRFCVTGWRAARSTRRQKQRRRWAPGSGPEPVGAA